MLKRAGIAFALLASVAPAHAQQPPAAKSESEKPAATPQTPTALGEILRGVDRQAATKPSAQPATRLAMMAAPSQASTDVTELLPELQTLRHRYLAAENEFFAMLPAGSLVSRNAAGIVSVDAPGADRRAANEAETAAFDVYAKIKQGYASANENGLGDISPEDVAAFDAANSAIAASLPSGARLRFSGAGYSVVGAGMASRRPVAAELEAITRRNTVIDRLAERARVAAGFRQSPQRILAAPELVGFSGSTKDRWAPVLSQTLIFNRAAVLTGNLSFRRDQWNEATLPSGTKMLVITDANSGKLAYCAPDNSGYGMRGTKSPWIPCFFDDNGDGLFEVISHGGYISDGVYSVVDKFIPHHQATVTRQAGASEIDFRDGIRQQVGLQVNWKSVERRTGAHPVAIHAWVGKDANSREVLDDAPVEFSLKPGETRTVSAFGAKLELQIVKDRLNYRIVQPMPEAPLSVKISAPRVR